MRAIKLFSSISKVSWGVFKFLGFIPATLEQRRRGETVEIFSMTWTGLITVAVTMYAAVILRCQEGIFNQSPIGNINDTLKFLTGSVAHFVSLCESMMKVRKFKLICKRLSLLDEECKNLNINITRYERKFLKSFAIRFLFFIVFVPLLELHVILSVDWAKFILANLFSTFACRLKHLQYMFYLHLILSKVKIIQIELVRSFDEASSRFHSSSNSSTGERDCEKLIDRLQGLKNVYACIWRTTHDINEMFVWSITANLIHNFVQIGCDSYWTVIKFSDMTVTEEQDDMTFLVFIVATTILIILVMLKDANHVKVESAKVPVILHSLRKSRDEFGLYKMVSCKVAFV